jgi:hypothetical protein
MYKVELRGDLDESPFCASTNTRESLHKPRWAIAHSAGQTAHGALAAVAETPQGYCQVNFGN